MQLTRTTAFFINTGVIIFASLQPYYVWMTLSGVAWFFVIEVARRKSLEPLFLPQLRVGIGFVATNLLSATMIAGVLGLLLGRLPEAVLAGALVGLILGLGALVVSRPTAGEPARPN
jgi:hypothetical protein